MAEIEIKLSEESERHLNQVAQLTGKSERDLVCEAVDEFLAKFRGNGDQLSALRKAKGLWKNRTDIIPLDEMRREANRDFNST